jgi:hypothetical protein
MRAGAPSMDRVLPMAAGVGGEAAAPQGVGNDGDGRTVGAVFFGGEWAAGGQHGGEREAGVAAQAAKRVA